MMEDFQNIFAIQINIGAKAKIFIVIQTRCMDWRKVVLKRELEIFPASRNLRLMWIGRKKCAVDFQSFEDNGSFGANYDDHLNS